MVPLFAAFVLAAAPTPTLLPGVGMGGVTLGMTRAQVEHRLGPGSMPTHDAGATCLWWQFGGHRVNELFACFAAKTGRAVTFTSASEGWRIPGTGFRLQTDDNIGPLKAAYTSRLHGPYTKSTGSFMDPDTIYYELPGTFEGRRVDTTFEVLVDGPDRRLIVGAHINYCTQPPLPGALPCHPR
jgi:hypothetical protein